MKIHRLVMLACFVTGVSVIAQEPAVSLEGVATPPSTPAASPPAPSGGVSITTADGVTLRAGMALVVEPGAQVEFEFTNLPTTGAGGWSSESATDAGVISATERVEWRLAGGGLQKSPEGSFRLRAPQTPGNATLEIAMSRTFADGAAGPKTDFKLAVLVKAPFDRAGNGSIEGYPIGVYPNEKGVGTSFIVQEHPELYAPPTAFIRVTPEVERALISEHFRLGNFSPASERGKPHFIALDSRLVGFLETAIQNLSGELGAAADGNPITILASFYSPNQLAQLRTQGVKIAEFTRYQYGDAASVVWDANGDGIFDDLNKDGKIDEEDARVLADKFDALQKKLGKFGGIGTAALPKLPGLPQTPYVDVDLRGVGTRW